MLLDFWWLCSPVSSSAPSCCTWEDLEKERGLGSDQRWGSAQGRGRSWSHLVGFSLALVPGSRQQLLCISILSLTFFPSHITPTITLLSPTAGAMGPWTHRTSPVSLEEDMWPGSWQQKLRETKSWTKTLLLSSHTRSSFQRDIFSWSP